MERYQRIRTSLLTARTYLRTNSMALLVGELWRRITHFWRRYFVFGRLHAPGLTLDAHCRLRGLSYLRIGRNFIAAEGLWLEALDRYSDQHFTPCVIIGDDVRISRWSHISAITHIEIGSGTLIGSNVFIADHNHGTYAGDSPSLPDVAPRLRQLGGGGQVVIGRNVWIGDNAVIIGPVTIGDGAIIAASTVVTQDVQSETIAAGIPARAIKRFSKSSGLWERQ